MNLSRNLYILALDVFGITSTEFGVIGVLPEIAIAFHISIDKYHPHDIGVNNIGYQEGNCGID